MQNEIISGAVGALVLTGAHEAGRRIFDDAPRMDVLGKRGLKKVLGRKRTPNGRALYVTTLAGDVLANGAFYALALLGTPKRPLLRSTTAGALMGLGALTLAKPLGLGKPPRSRSASNRAMTIAWYALGALAAGAVYQRMRSNDVV